MQSTEVHEKKLLTDLQGGSGGRKSARWGRAEHVKFKRKAKGMEKTTKWAMKVCSVGGRKGSKEGSIISFPPADESCRRAEASWDYGGPTLLRLSRICSAGFSTVSSHLDTSVASRPYTAGTLSPGPTRTHTHTRQTHTVRPAFPSFIHLQRTWGKKLLTTTFWQTWQKISQQCIWVQVSYRQPACWWGQTTQLHATC